MSTNVGSIHYDLGLNTNKFDRAADGIKGKIGKIGSGLKVLAKGAAIGGAAIAAVGAIGVKAWTDQENAIAQLNAVLKSTKGVAGVTSKAAQDLASSLQSVTTYADEVILGGENVLLTFTKIGKDIFPQATETMLDMSQALGQDLKASAIQLGKALQDPILGVTALRRVGVNFSSDQQEVIKKLVETGRTAEAQRMILKELNTEFGGSARAAAKTFGGQMTQLKNIFGDFMEEVGKGIATRIQPLIQGLLKWIDSMGGLSGVMSAAGSSIRQFYQDRLQPMVKVVMDVATAVGNYLWPKFYALYDTIANELAPALLYLWRSIIVPLLPIIGTALVIAIGAVVDIVNAVVSVFSWWINSLRQGNVIVYAATAAFVALGAALMLGKAIQTTARGLMLLETVTIPRVIARVGAMRALIASPLGMGAIVVTAALTSIALVVRAVQSARRAIQDLNNASNAARAAADSNAAVIQRLNALAKSGNAAQQERARKAMAGLAAGGSFATGTLNAPGGWSMVGERGPELVNLPAGSKVYPASRTRQMMQGDANTSIYGNVYIGSQQDADYLLMRLNRSIEQYSFGLAGA